MANERYNSIAKGIILVTVTLYVLPYLLLGGNAYIRLHDNLEGEWIWMKILTDSHTAFTLHPFSNVPQIMNGLPRSVYPTCFNVNMALVQVTNLFSAYIISNFLIRIIGFVGMTLLLRTYFIKERENQYIVWLCALIFSTVSIFMPFGISVLGQPLLLWAFLNLNLRKHRRISYAVIGLFPFYSSVVWIAIPFSALLFFVGIHFYRQKTLNRHYFLGFGLLVFMYALVNAPIISTAFIHGDFIPHRLAYNLYMFETPQIVDAVGDTVLLFFTAHYHVAIFLSNICFIAVLLMTRRRYPLVWALMFGIVAICLFQGFYSYIEYWVGGKWELAKSFRFNRFSMLLPFMWLFAFALSLYRMRETESMKSFVMPFLILQLIVGLFGNDELVQNYHTITGKQKFPGYENYLAPNQFKHIKQYINQPVENYRVASLGISPSVAQYNGMYTLDGLMSVYDLRYKTQFRKIFVGEINKSKEIQQYFDGWGNRCYIYSAELGTKHPAYNCYKFEPKTLEHFEFDAKAFLAIGGKYLISAVEIKNHEQDGLKLEGIFRDDQSWWTIYLYSVKPGA